MLTKLLVRNILNIEIMIYIRKYTLVNILGHVPYQEVRIITGTCKASIKLSAEDK